MKLVKKAKWSYICISAIMILLGIVLILFPEVSALTVCCIIGAMMLIFGVVKLVGYFSRDLFRLAFQFDFALGLLTIAAGLLMLIHPGNFVAAMPVFLGLIMLVDGAFKLQTTADAKRFGMRRWWAILIFAVITCAAGIFLIINPFTGVKALMILLGVSLIVDGVQNICIVIYTVREASSLDDEPVIVYDERHYK